MTRTRETIDRDAWQAMLAGLRDGDVENQLSGELDEWAGGDCSPMVSVTLDATGRLDSMSDPQPEWS